MFFKLKFYIQYTLFKPTVRDAGKTLLKSSVSSITCGEICKNIINNQALPNIVYFPVAVDGDVES
jgi:hypothetical protein